VCSWHRDFIAFEPRRQVDRMKRVDEYQRDVVMMSKIDLDNDRTERLKRDKVELA
jgi:hypothetical protein